MDNSILSTLDNMQRFGRVGPARLFLMGLAAAALVVFVGCAAGLGEVNLGPIYYSKHHKAAGVTEREILWPLLHFEDRPAERHAALRPLFYSVAGREGEFREVRFLWPIGLYRRTKDRFTFRIYPIFYYVSRINVNGERDIDYSLFPLIFGGTDPSEGSYFALFPLMGRLKGLLGKDEMRFFLFPLYFDSRDGEHRARNVLWPMFHYSRGGGRRGIRIWPFWGEKERAGRERRSFALWPLFAWGEKYRTGKAPKDPKEPMKSFFALPFYGFQETPTGRIDYALFPFFSYQAEERRGEPYTELSAPWPLFTLGRGRDYLKWYSWPLFGYKRNPSVRKGFALYPLLWFREDLRRGYRTVRRWALPLYWSTAEIEADGETRASKTKVWPLFDCRRTSEGRRRFTLLSPLWFSDPRGVERSYGAFWTLYEQGRGGASPSWRRVLWQYFGERAEEDFVCGRAGGPSPLEAIRSKAAGAASLLPGGGSGGEGDSEKSE